MKKFLSSVLFLAAGLVLGIALTLLWQGGGDLPAAPSVPAATPPAAAATPSPEVTPTPTPTPETVPDEDPAMADNGLPKDKVYITETRKGYSDGDLQLIIPKLNVDVPVLNGVDAQTLLRGVGLYDYAQLPSEGGANVSIAGHRNGLRGGKITDNMPFYYINTLTEGDFLYLVNDTHIYQYQWECTEVIEPDNWGPIFNQGYGCVTLTTCTPIGVADHRLVVRGALVKTLELDESYPYPANTSEE